MTFTVRESVGDLAAAAKALRKVDKDLAKELGQNLRAATDRVKKVAQGRAGGRPGGGTYKRSPGAIRSGASPTKASAWIGYPGSSVARYPWVLGGEYGSYTAWVFGRAMSAARLSRPQFPPWVGNQFSVKGGSGWIVGATLEQEFPRLERELLDAISDAFAKALARTGG